MYSLAHHPVLLRWTSLIFAICFTHTANVEADVTFTGLGVFGANSSAARDVSADGSVVVGTLRGPFAISGIFRWTASESMTRAGSAFDHVAVSGDGSVVVGGFPIDNVLQAFRWNEDGTFEGLGDLPGGRSSSTAFDVSADGRVVAGVGSAAINDEAFRWTRESGMVGIGDLPGGQTRSAAYGISADGGVVVGESYGSDDRQQPFRWTAEGGMVGLGFLPGATDAFARRVSPDGSVVVGTYGLPPLGHLEPQRGAFRWTESDGMVSLGDLPGGLNFSDAFDVSADGSVIVGTSQTVGQGGTSVAAAFYWTAATGMVNLQDVLLAEGANLDGWTLTEARGVSHDGLTIVGSGVHNGIGEAWVATIPEPSTIVLAVIAGAGLFGYYFRKYLTRRSAAAID
jgi:probable HAF family extracellular repeat protein